MEIDKLSKQDLIDTKVVQYLSSIKDPIEKLQIKVRLSERAKELKISPEWRKMIKIQEEGEKLELLKSSDNYNLGLKCNSEGKTLDSIENFNTIFATDPLYKDKFSFNELNFRGMYNGKDMTDTDYAKIASQIESKYGIFKEPKLQLAIKVAHDQHKFHPIKTIIESVTWDKKPRIHDFLIKYLNTENSDYARECSRLIFAGGINRIYEPRL